MLVQYCDHIKQGEIMSFVDETKCDGDVATSPTAVDNPEYFDELLTAGAMLEVRPTRLRSQSTESTASDHDEYDRLNCCSQLRTNGMIDIDTAHQLFAESVL